ERRVSGGPGRRGGFRLPLLGVRGRLGRARQRLPVGNAGGQRRRQHGHRRPGLARFAGQHAAAARHRPAWRLHDLQRLLNGNGTALAAGPVAGRAVRGGEPRGRVRRLRGRPGFRARRL
ncbi:MAG: Fluoride ion transporter CrcB, partial [uncultured Acetobacteraceae bacterium]